MIYRVHQLAITAECSVLRNGKRNGERNEESQCILIKARVFDDHKKFLFARMPILNLLELVCDEYFEIQSLNSENMLSAYDEYILEQEYYELILNPLQCL